MLDNIEERLTDLENTVGIDDHDIKSIDIKGLRSRLVLKRCCLSHNVPVDKLRRLKEVMEKPDNRSLSEKLQFVQCCADINRKRAALLQAFENSLKVVLNKDDLSKIDEYDKQLEPIRKDIEIALELWKENTVKIEDFRKDYVAVASSLQEYIQKLAEQVQILEHKMKAVSFASCLDEEEFFDA